MHMRTNGHTIIHPVVGGSVRQIVQAGARDARLFHLGGQNELIGGDPKCWQKKRLDEKKARFLHPSQLINPLERGAANRELQRFANAAVRDSHD